MFSTSVLFPRGSIRRDSLTTSSWSLLGKGLGFMIPFFIAAWFGAGSDTDAFFYVYGVILFLANIYAALAESVAVPFITESCQNPGGVKAFVSRLLGTGSLILALGSALALIVFRTLVPVVTRFNPKTLSLLETLFLETLPLLFLMGISSTLVGAANAMKAFSLPAFSPGIRALIAISVIGLTRNPLGIHAIPLGYLCGELLRLLTLAGFIHWRRILPLSVSFRFDHRVRAFYRTSGLQTLGLVVVSLIPVVDITMASWLGATSVSILHYANRLYFIPIALLSSGLAVVILSHWSHRFASQGIQRLQRDVRDCLKWFTAFSILLMVALALFSGNIVTIVYGHGRMTGQLTGDIQLVWLLYLTGLIPQAMNIVLIQAHLILKNARALFNLAWIATFTNILFNYLFMTYCALPGISLASAVVQYLVAIYAWRAFANRAAMLSIQGPADTVLPASENRSSHGR